MKRILTAIVGAAALLATGGAHATAYQGSSGVSATSTVDFTNDGLLQNAPIAELYSGLSFSGAFQNYIDPVYPNGDGQYAANYTTGGATSGADALTIQFSVPVTDATFSINSDVSGVRIYSFLNGSFVDSLTTNTDFTESNNYYGFVNSSFNYLVIDPGSISNFFDIDNLSYGAPSSAPEPSTWALMIMGVGLAGVFVRFGRRQEESTIA